MIQGGRRPGVCWWSPAKGLGPALQLSPYSGFESRGQPHSLRACELNNETVSWGILDNESGRVGQRTLSQKAHYLLVTERDRERA